MHEFEANPCLGPIDEETGFLAHVKGLNASLHLLHDLLFAVLKGLLQLLVTEGWAIRPEKMAEGLHGVCLVEGVGALLIPYTFKR